MLNHVWGDLRYGIRSLARSRGFTVATIVTIALGVGLNTGIFSIINGVLFRDLPAPNARELVSIYQTLEAPGLAGVIAPASFTTGEYEAIRDGSSTLSGILGLSNPTSVVLGGGAQQQIGGLLVTCDYFAVLEQPPAIGRALTGSDCRRGADPVVVVSHELWTTTLAADPAIIGRSIELDRQLFTVVGVAREDTYGGRFRAAFFAPISVEPLVSDEGRYASADRWLTLIGRRADGVGIDQVRAELAVIAARFDLEQPERSASLSVERAKPNLLPPFVRGPALGGATVLMTAFGLILLIACANVANLLLARSTARSSEFGVRLSLGAGRRRLMLQLLTESVLLSIVGGVLGSLLAFWSFQALLTLAIPTILPVGLPPLAVDASPDLRVLTVTLVLTLGTGIGFGLVPALRASRTDLHSIMKQDSAGAGSSRGGSRLQGVLLGAQVALCMVLIIGAGLLLRGLYAAQTLDPRFDAGSVTVLSYDYAEDTGHRDDPAFWLRLREEIVALPGVEAAAYASREPLGDDFGYTAIRLPPEDDSELRSAVPNFVSSDYFSVVGLPVVRGRTFAEGDFASGADAAIVSESTARNLWGDADPIGRTLVQRVGFGPDQAVEHRIVGVVGDGQVSSLGRVDPYYVYLPRRSSEKLLVRSRLDFAATAAAIREVVRSLDPGLPAPLYPLEANLDRWRGISGLVTMLAGALGALALALAAVGIYGVVAYFVGRRFRELGIRLALGAHAASIYGLTLQRTMRPVAIGAVIGIAGAAAASGILSSVLFGVSPLDPLGLGGAALFVLGISLAAGAWAARRAAHVNPVVTLRHE
jgi:putative ABC transport system permease protein